MVIDISMKELGVVIMVVGLNEMVFFFSEKEWGVGFDYFVGFEIVKDWSDEEEKRFWWKYDVK